jgi:hypothetical protein
MKASTALSEGQLVTVRSRKPGFFSATGAGQYRLQSSARTERFDQNGLVLK